MIDADVSLNGVIWLTVPFAWSLIEVESVAEDSCFVLPLVAELMALSSYTMMGTLTFSPSCLPGSSMVPTMCF